MKKEAINFNVELKDAFGNVVKEKKTHDAKEKTVVMIGESVVSILSHPHSLPDEKKMDANEIVKRLLLQQKVASKTPQTYNTDELSVIRESVINMFNKRMLNVELAGIVLKMTE